MSKTVVLYVTVTDDLVSASNLAAELQQLVVDDTGAGVRRGARDRGEH